MASRRLTAILLFGLLAILTVGATGDKIAALMAPGGICSQDVDFRGITKLNGQAIATQAYAASMCGGGSATWGGITGALANQTDLSAALASKVNASLLAAVAYSGDYNALSNKPTIPTVPTLATVATSGLYSDLTGKPSIPAAQVNSDWSASSGLAAILNKPSLFSGAYADLTGKPSLFSGAYADLSGKPSLFSGSYLDLTNKPTIPAEQVNSDWSASSGLAQILNKPSLATIATSGSYADLSNKPSIPAAQVQTDWNASTGLGVLLNKPTLFSGAYADLTGKPTLFDGTYASLSGKPSLAMVATSGAYSDLTGKPTIPAAQVQTDWNASSGLGVLLNKPSLATVATSGSYADLSNKPTIPSTPAGVGLGNVSNVAQVTSVTGTAPVISSGGTTPVISMAAATSSVDGYLAHGDWATFNSKQAALGFTAVPNTRTVAGHALSADVTVSASDVGLGNVSNALQLAAANNLSDVASAATARANLGVDKSQCPYRLSLASGTPTHIGDIIGASTLYACLVPTKGDRIALYGTTLSADTWRDYAATELSLAGTNFSAASTIYDIYVANTGTVSTPTLSLSAVAWFNSAAGNSMRSVDITPLNGIIVKSGKQIVDGFVAPNTNTSGVYLGNNTQVGQAINLSAGKTISGVRFPLARLGSPSGTMTASIYACSGTPGSTGVPTGSALATSSTVDIATVQLTPASQPGYPGPFQWVEFAFATPYVASAGNYCLSFNCTAGNASNCIYYGHATPSGHAGNFFSYNGSVYAPAANYDGGFQLLVSTSDASAPAYRYLGTIITNSNGGQIDLVFGANALAGGSYPRCGLWNAYNRQPGSFQVLDSTAQWTYTTFAWRQRNGGTAANNRFGFIVGFSSEVLDGGAISRCGSSNSTPTNGYVGVGINSTTSPTGITTPIFTYGNVNNTGRVEVHFQPSIGYTYLADMELAVATGTMTWYGSTSCVSNYTLWY